MPHAKFRADPLKTVAVYYKKTHKREMSDNVILLSHSNLLFYYISWYAYA